MTVEDRLNRYARLLCELGVALQPGQQLAVNAHIEHAPLARAIAEHAYSMGAEYVDVWYWDPFAKLSRLRHAPEESLAATPSWLDARYQALAANGGALINVTGDPHPRLLEGIDERRCGLDKMPALASRLAAQRESTVAWTAGAFPTPEWAEEVYGTPDVDRLWDDVATCLRLDSPDPVASWNARLSELRERAEALTRWHFEALHYVGPGTDLRIGLIPEGTWQISELVGPRGVPNVLNLPTEEVYTTPDASRADGHVTTTRPLALVGTVVEPFTLTLEGGRIVDVDGTRGVDVVRSHIASDDGACRFGEVALVDASSAVRATGTVFKDTLFDENATCHIAWGAGIPSVFPGWRASTTSQLAGLGMNLSNVHVDFMVGGPEVQVSGLTNDGRLVPILTDETWVLPEA